MYCPDKKQNNFFFKFVNTLCVNDSGFCVNDSGFCLKKEKHDIYIANINVMLNLNFIMLFSHFYIAKVCGKYFHFNSYSVNKSIINSEILSLFLLRK